jgi:hypothetical protein
MFYEHDSATIIDIDVCCYTLAAVIRTSVRKVLLQQALQLAYAFCFAIPSKSTKTAITHSSPIETEVHLSSAAQPNASGEPRPIAEATQERKLLGVGSTAMFGAGVWRDIRFTHCPMALVLPRLLSPVC